MQVKFPEQIQKCSAIRTIFLILIKDHHAKEHSHKKALHAKQIRFSSYVISHQKQITEDKCGMIIHNYIVASQDHQQKDTYSVYKKCRHR